MAFSTRLRSGYIEIVYHKHRNSYNVRFLRIKFILRITLSLLNIEWSTHFYYRILYRFLQYYAQDSRGDGTISSSTSGRAYMATWMSCIAETNLGERNLHPRGKNVCSIDSRGYFPPRVLEKLVNGSVWRGNQMQIKIPNYILTSETTPRRGWNIKNFTSCPVTNQPILLTRIYNFLWSKNKKKIPKHILTLKTTPRDQSNFKNFTSCSAVKIQSIILSKIYDYRWPRTIRKFPTIYLPWKLPLTGWEGVQFRKFSSRAIKNQPIFRITDK